jgi:hypothetical protein
MFPYQFPGMRAATFPVRATAVLVVDSNRFMPSLASLIGMLDCVDQRNNLRLGTRACGLSRAFKQLHVTAGGFTSDRMN